MKILLSLLFLIISAQMLVAQGDSISIVKDYEAELAKLEAELETDDLFGLIDSILLSIDEQPASEFNVRLGYSSNVTNGGRDFNLNQYGLSPGLSFFHSSGAFADVSGFWNSEFDPKYNITIASLGYLGRLGKSFNVSTSFDYWFFNEGDSEISESPNKSINASIEYTKKPISIGLDYSYLFGPVQAHRLSANISGRWQTKEWIKGATLSIQPMFNLLYGNQFIVIQFNGRLADELRSNEYLQANLQSPEFAEFLTTISLSQEAEQRIENIGNNRFLSEERKRNLISLIYLADDEVQNYIFEQLETTNEEYGVMNYTFSLPVTLSFKKFMFLLSYSYNIPVELPGETVDLDPIGIFSGTVIYRIPFK